MHDLSQVFSCRIVNRIKNLPSPLHVKQALQGDKAPGTPFLSIIGSPKRRKLRKSVCNVSILFSPDSYLLVLGSSLPLVNKAAQSSLFSLDSLSPPLSFSCLLSSFVSSYLDWITRASRVVGNSLKETKNHYFVAFHLIQVIASENTKGAWNPCTNTQGNTSTLNDNDELMVI